MAVLFALVAGHAGSQVLVVMSDETTAYREVERAVRAEISALRGGRLEVDTVSVGELGDRSAQVLSAYELIVTVGLAAAQASEHRQGALGVSRPTLCLLVPRQSFERLAESANRTRPLSAVYIDQPLSRQFDLIRIAMPDKSRVGVLLGPVSAALDRDLVVQGRERKLVINAAIASETSEVYRTLKTVLAASDLLLAVPDPVAFNASTAYAILLASYHAQVPVIGFSQSMVDAGALVGLFSTPRQQGRHGGEIAARFLGGGTALPAPQFPRYFTVASNASVARSLGIRLDGDASMAAALAARARGRAAEPASGDAPGARRVP